MSNQASEDELKQRFATLFYDDNYEFMLSEPDLFDVGAIDAAVELIRTEKLKLLAEVMEQTTIFKIKAHDKKGQPHLYEVGRGVTTDVLTKLEAEL